MITRTAAILVIGNEILTGKFADRNVHFIANQLASIGIALRRVIVCPDEVDTIADDLRALHRTHDFVFTTGGVGPTHDDLTYPSVAAAFGVGLVREPGLEKLIRDRFKDRTRDEHLRMADIPAGSALVTSDEMRWPTVRKENVYIFPGVPEIIFAKFASIRAELDDGSRFYRGDVLTLCDEFEITEQIDRTDAAFQDVRIGSYLNWKGQDYRVRITFEGSVLDRVAEAMNHFVGLLDDGLVHSTVLAAPISVLDE